MPITHERLFELLTSYHREGVFNQYRDVHPDLDQPDGAEVRCHNLSRYLEAFTSARFVLVGEAAGYAGCRSPASHSPARHSWSGRTR